MIRLLKLIGALVLGLVVLYLIYKVSYRVLRNFHYKRKADDFRFLQIKIPRKSSESDKEKDNIKQMKQNIEVMNQIYKNFYSVITRKLTDRIFGYDSVSLEMFVEKENIKFILWVPVNNLESFEKIISSFYPWCVVDRIPQPQLLEAGKYAYGGHFGLYKDDAYPIKTYENFEADPMDSLLSSFSRVEWEEKLCLKIQVAPLREKWQTKLRKKDKSILSWSTAKWFFGSVFKVFDFMTWKNKDSNSKEDNNFSSSQEQAIEKKVEDEGFNVCIKAMAVSPFPDRGRKIIQDLKRAFSQYNYVGLNRFSFLKPKDMDSFLEKFVTRSFRRPWFTFKEWQFFIKSQILNVKELSGIYHFPHFRFNKNPRIKWQNYKIVPAPDSVPKEGIMLGYNNYAGVKKDIKVAPKDRLRHFYIVGQTGTGKSSIMLLQAQQDVKKWNWFCMIDPHGDLSEHILKNYPKDRVDDLIYFNAGDFERPVWFNILWAAKTEDERDLITNDLVDMFVQMYWPKIFGPRIQDYFRNAVLTLMEQPDGGTLTEIVRLFTDEAFKQSKVKHVENPVVRSWWEKTYDSMGDREKNEMIPYFQSKFGPFTTTPIIRNIIGQPESSFDVYEAMQDGKIILLNLSKGKMGELNSKLLGSMMVTQLKVSALRRAQIPEEERNPFYLYIDEFQNFVSPSIETILSEARKYKLGLVMAHQYIDQLKQDELGGSMDLKWAIFGNVWTQMAYKVGAQDAEFLEKEYWPEFSQNDLVNIDKYKAVMKLSVDTQPTRPFSLDVKNPYGNDLNDADKVEVLKEISRLKWWRPKDKVEKEIYYRVGA